MKIYIHRPEYSPAVGPFFSSKEKALDYFRYRYRHASNCESVAQFYGDHLIEIELDDPLGEVESMGELD